MTTEYKTIAEWNAQFKAEDVAAAMVRRAKRSLKGQPRELTEPEKRRALRVGRMAVKAIGRRAA